jgi:hypothetical protein
MVVDEMRRVARDLVEWPGCWCGQVAGKARYRHALT